MQIKTILAETFRESYSLTALPPILYSIQNNIINVSGQTTHFKGE